MSFYKPPRFRFLLANLLPGRLEFSGAEEEEVKPVVCVCIRSGLRARSLEGQSERMREKNTGEVKERRRKRERERRPRRWTPRVSPRRRNGKSAAAGVR